MEALVGEACDSPEQGAVPQGVPSEAQGQHIALPCCLLPAGQQAVGAALAAQAHARWCSWLCKGQGQHDTGQCNRQEDCFQEIFSAFQIVLDDPRAGAGGWTR